MYWPYTPFSQLTSDHIDMNKCASFFRGWHFKNTIVDEHSVIATRSYWFDGTNPGKSSQNPQQILRSTKVTAISQISLLTAAVTWCVKLYFRWKSCDLTRSRKSFLPPSPPPPPPLPDSYHKTCGALWYAKLTRIGHTPFILPNLSLRKHAKRYFIRPLYLHALQFVSDRQMMERSRWLRNYWSENLRTVRENT